MKIRIERAGKREIIMIENAVQSDILPGRFRNFRGEKRQYNNEGERNFNVVLNLPVEALDDLAALGLNIKEIAGNEEYGDAPTRFVKVNIKYGSKVPPQLYLVTDRNMKELNQNELGLLDGARFTNVDMVINTYHKDEKSCTLYLQKGWFTIEQDPLEAKYANLNFDALDALDADEELPF